MAATIKTELAMLDGSFSRGFKAAADAVRRWRHDVSGSMDRVKQSVSNAKIGLVGAGAAGLGLKKALDEAGKFETYEAQMKVLLGSTEAAKDRMQELADFCANTPFDLAGVVKASITLQTLTRGALSTGKGLKMTGDIAAATNQPIEELAVHVGRLYDGLMSGRAVGESMARLQELGAISGDTRAEIEAMQKAGMQGEVVWQKAAGSFATFGGTMDAISGTLEGRISNLSDRINELWREMGKPISDALGPILTDITDNLGDYKDTARAVGEAIRARHFPWPRKQTVQVMLYGVRRGFKKIRMETASFEDFVDTECRLNPRLSRGKIMFELAKQGIRK
ncbi:MAG: hypothetical protein QM680_06570 [Luteolibacter sp.]